MRIYDMMVNRLRCPVGYTLFQPRFSYKVDQTAAKRQEAAQIRIALNPRMEQPLYDSGKSDQIDSLCFLPGISLAPRTRYWWQVTVWAEGGDSAVSEIAFFETGKLDEPWSAPWITSDVPGNMNLYRDVEITKPLRRARVYMVGLGVYELMVDGQKIGDELLAPFYNDYESWIQACTYDTTAVLTPGSHRLGVMLGDGWYKGRFGFQGQLNLYGDRQAMLLELHLDYEDGSHEVVQSGTDWWATESRVRFANIYDGETYDATFDDTRRYPTRLYDKVDTAKVMDRLSPPVRVIERLAPKEILLTPAGETVLDLGQEITGYLEFRTAAPKGTTLKLSYFEILQEGNFYRDNLRSALQEQTYVSDGQEAVVRPHFTFYGFRYVKLEGFGTPALSDFAGCVVHSDIQPTMAFTCANEKVNRLALNAYWGQRGNFLDVPTDCPQRDERMGWTGDAQAFCGTACFQMESAAFFQKYLYDMYGEQRKTGGAVPHVVPRVGLKGEGSCAWADAATIIPWTTYLFYGDKELLRLQYPNMRDWVEWIYRTDEADGGKRLWDTGFHFADWLALDTKDGTPMGGTDPLFIASAYYYYSTSLLLKAAKALGKQDDIARYEKLRGEIRSAIQREYFTPAGRLAQSTQTAYVCALFMGFALPDQVPVLRRLLTREFEQSQGKLRTGFVGTAYLCRTLSMVGLDDLAYDLLLNEEYPGWLYEVNMGATTVWERWNSVLPDGSISDTGMNSLNHYAYGAVMEWVYRDVVGLAPTEDAPGFRRALIRPLPSEKLGAASASFDSAVGTYASRWTLQEDRFDWRLEIPFGGTGLVVFPRADVKALCEAHPEITFTEDQGLRAELPAGSYHFTYAFAEA